MNSGTFKRAGLKVGLAVTAALALCAFASAGSAAAETQHWAGSSQVPYGASQEFSGEATGSFKIDWHSTTIYCGSMSTSGAAENPADGGSGTLESESLQLGNCFFAGGIGSRCAIEGDSITLALQQDNQAIEESGEDVIAYAIRSSHSDLHIVQVQGGWSCGLTGTYWIGGRITASPAAESPGEYVFDSDEFEIIGLPASINGRFGLSTPSEEALVISSDASPGAPHWYLGSAEWSTLAAGESSAFSANDGMSFDLSANIAGANVEFSCDSGATEIEGSLENPSGGGAGAAGASAGFGDCVIAGALGERCEVPAFESNELSGAATEVGGAPAVEFTGAEGNAIASFSIVEKEGAPKKCPVKGNGFILNGTLIADSGEDGHFDLSSEGLTLNGIYPASAGGGFVLEDEAAQTLRIQS